MKEIEIKLKIEDSEALRKKAESLGGKFLPEKSGFEHDVMFEKEGGNFFHDYKVLRLRKTTHENLLTYKERLDEPEDSNLLRRLELQTTFRDFETMQKILEKLGYHPYVIKEKEANVYELDGLHVEFHKMPFLGDFVEIEGDEPKLKQIVEKLGLDFKQGINNDYTHLFFNFCDEHGIDRSTSQTFDEERKFL
ncbi:MAG: class IV adenylate cyclase [Candidatus Doudnabacteria bacterium]|nr:class IV adenylate cyclase [Candidatus Doudnabacteria bacterium]